MDTPETPVIKPAKKPRKKRTPEQLAAEMERQRIRRGMQLVKDAQTLEKGERMCRGTSAVRDAEGNKVIGPDGKVLRKPCRKPPIKGGRVCSFHGGSAGHVKAAANRRMLALVEPAISRLGVLIEQDTHLATALGAIRTVLERAGDSAIGALKKDTGDKDSRPVINIGIKVGGIANPHVEVQALTAGGGDEDDDDYEEGELVGDE